MPSSLAFLARRAALAALLAGPLAAPPAGATLVVYEPFDYDPETVLDGEPANALGLAGTYTGNLVPPGFDLLARSPGLDAGSLVGPPAALGSRLTQASGTTFGNVTASLAQPLPVGPGEALYWSALFTLDDSLNGNHFASIAFVDDATGDEIGFGEPVVGMGGIRVSAFDGATGDLVSSGADNAFVDGHTLLLVGRYLSSAVPDGDRLDLLVYDTADADALPAVFDPADPGAEFAFTLDGLDVALAQVTSVRFAIRGTDNNSIDELRLGTDYGSVVPEPATALLLLSGLAALAAVRRSAT